jgi:ribose transport system permease protein
MISKRQRAIVELVLDNLVWFMLVAVLAVFSLAIPNFFQIGIFANIVEQSTFVGVMAIGLAIVIIAGNMDLSVESIAALTAMVTGILFCARGIGLGYTLTPEWLVLPVSLFIALAAGGLIGALNGWLVVGLKMNAFIVTLASYIWVAVRRGDFRRPFGPGPGAVAAVIGIQIHLHSADRLIAIAASRSSPSSWSRRLR